MDEYNDDDFKPLEDTLRKIGPPPLLDEAKVQSQQLNGSNQNNPYVKMVYYNGRFIPSYSTVEPYSYSHIRRVLYEKYDYYIRDITGYKETRYGNHLKSYQVYNAQGDVIIEKCNLNQLAAYLIANGDY